MSALLSDSTFWAFLGLIVFFALIVVIGAPGMVTKALDQRADSIRAELEEAKRLRGEAQERLAAYERRQREAEQEAEEIIEQAKVEARYLREEARKDLAERLERRTQMAERRIAQAQAQAEKEVRALAANLAVEAAEKLLKSKLSKTDRNRLLDSDIKAVEEQIH